MKSTSRFGFALLAIALISSSNAFAGFVYDEAVDGDLPHELPLPILPFELGTNTVSGTISIIDPLPLNQDIDPDKFAFSVPAGSQVDTITMAFIDEMGDFLFSHWVLRSGSNAFGPTSDPSYIEDLHSIPSPGVVSFTQLPLGPGLYNLANSGVGNTTNASSAYVITFSISQVPEPSSLLLVSLLLGITGVQCRSRAA